MSSPGSPAPPAIVLMFLLAATWLDAAPIINVQPLAVSNPVAYQRLEWTLEWDRACANPFDPEEISIEGIFTGPGGRCLKIPAFWCQDFERTTNGIRGQTPRAVGAPHWRVRFAAPMAGRWTLQASARDRTGEGWYNYIAPHNMWDQLTPLSRSAKTIDWPRTHFKPIPIDSPTYNQPQARGSARDIVLTAAGDWGKSDPTPRIVGSAGLLSSTLPTFLFGPQKPEFRTKLVIQVDQKIGIRMRVRFQRASAACLLRVEVDDHVVGEWPFRPQPESARAAGAARSENDYPKYALAEADREREAELPAGTQQLTLDLVEGDWLTLESITLAKARPAQVTGLEPMGLSDPDTGETIAWVHDPDSNWYGDFRKIQPALFEDMTLLLPVLKRGSYSVHWWDTYSGRILRTDTLETQDGHLTLSPPSFRRDIALHAVRK